MPFGSIAVRIRSDLILLMMEIPHDLIYQIIGNRIVQYMLVHAGFHHQQQGIMVRCSMCKDFPVGS